jgi:hypothetical protein
VRPPWASATRHDYNAVPATQRWHDLALARARAEKQSLNHQAHLAAVLPTALHDAVITTCGKADISLNFVAPLLIQMDVGDPIVLLAGVHVGCFVLFGTERVRAVRDLKGKTDTAVAGPVLRIAACARARGLRPDRVQQNRLGTGGQHHRAVDPAAKPSRLRLERRDHCQRGCGPG